LGFAKITLFTTSAFVILAAFAVLATQSPLPALALGEYNDKPVKIEINSQAIDLAVVNGEYSHATGKWEISETSAFFAVASASPNSTSGNTLIYAHNRSNLFAKTVDLAIGDEIVVTTNSRKLYKYLVTGAEDVDPKNTTILSYQGRPQLTLLTCSGAADSTRRLTYAKLLNKVSE